MLTLTLFRHAKSSWDDPSLDDFHRPLAARGEHAAPRMGAYMQEHDIRPNLILCSTAERAMQTLKAARKAQSNDFTRNTQVRYEDWLYMAAPHEMINHVRKLGDTATHVMLVGHNPGMHLLALNLAHEGERDDLIAMAEKFPTAALARLTFDIDDWHDLTERSGHLVTYMVPKRLPASAD